MIQSEELAEVTQLKSDSFVIVNESNNVQISDHATENMITENIDEMIQSFKNENVSELIADASQIVVSDPDCQSLDNSTLVEFSILNQSMNKLKEKKEYDWSVVKTKIQKSYKQVAISRKMKKYYNRRYLLYSRFDDGILLDNESWFSVTPEKTAKHIANEIYEKMGFRQDLTILDAFCGSGGNTIQFCKYFDNVISCDIDFVKLNCAQNNSHIYKTEDNVRFIVQDFFSLHKTLNDETKIDVIFLSPPWGGINYFQSKQADISEFPLDCFKIFLYCINELKCKNIVYFLPRNTNLEQILFMAGPGGKCKIEQNFLDHKLVALTAYYGDLCEDFDIVE